eukprot:8008399-Pyramimonas_sp.AAC.1
MPPRAAASQVRGWESPAARRPLPARPTGAVLHDHQKQEVYALLLLSSHSSFPASSSSKRDYDYYYYSYYYYYYYY